MRKSYIASLVVSISLAAGGAAEAGTLTTGLMYWDDGSPGTACFVTGGRTFPVQLSGRVREACESARRAGGRAPQPK